jgi:hypothetical protein
VRRHHPQLEAGAAFLGAVANGLQSAARRLGGICLDQRRVEPRQVAPQRIEIRADVNGTTGTVPSVPLRLLDDLRAADLVLRVAIAEEQADADALDARVEQRRRRLAHILLAQRQHLLPHHVDPAADALHQLALDDRRVVVVGRDVEAVRVREPQVGLDPALDHQVVLLPGGDDRADPPPGAREQAVQHRRAAEDPRDDPRESLLRRHRPLAERVLGRRHEALGLVLGRRLRLADDERAGPVDDERVGHRAARVDREDARVPALGRPWVLAHPANL